MSPAHVAVPVPHGQRPHAVAHLVHGKVAPVAHEDFIALKAIRTPAHLAVVLFGRKVCAVKGEAAGKLLVLQLQELQLQVFPGEGGGREWLGGSGGGYCSAGGAPNTCRV